MTSWAWVVLFLVTSDTNGALGYYRSMEECMKARQIVNEQSPLRSQALICVPTRRGNW